MRSKAEPWPKGCCVAAFVAAALMQRGMEPSDRARLAQALGTTVEPGSLNPFQLKTEPDPFLRGVPLSRALELIPRVLGTFDPEMAFRHILFCEIAVGLVEDVLAQGHASGCIMGVGLDFAPFVHQVGPLRHVCRISPTSHPEEVTLIDDSSGTPPWTRKTRWTELLPLVFSLSEGFWCIGARAELHFDFAPSWDSSNAT